MADRDSQIVGRSRIAAARRRALAPRRAFFAVAAALALLGVKALVLGLPEPPPAKASAPEQAPPLSAAGFAEAFARAYLTWDSGAPEQRVRALRPFLGRDVDPDAGLPVPVSGAQRVTWTTAIEETPAGRGRATVTVAAALDRAGELRYLAVPVARDGRGALAVVDYPGLVGRPAQAPALGARRGEELRDDALAEVLERFLANYLAGAAANLRADLAAGAAVASPPRPLSLEDVAELRWSAHGRVGAIVIARDREDVAYTLRYELAVARRDRWYVRGINTPTDSREESR